MGQAFTYTNGEVHSLVAPLIDEQPENIVQIVILAETKDGMVMKGNENAAKMIAFFILMSLEETAQNHGPEYE